MQVTTTREILYDCWNMDFSYVIAVFLPHVFKQHDWKIINTKDRYGMTRLPYQKTAPLKPAIWQRHIVLG